MIAFAFAIPKFPKSAVGRRGKSNFAVTKAKIFHDPCAIHVFRQTNWGMAFS